MKAAITPLSALVLLAAVFGCATAAPEPPAELPPPVAGIFAVEGDAAVVVCDFADIRTDEAVEDLTSDSLLSIPAAVNTFEVRLSDEALRFGIGHRTLELVSLVPRESRPKITIVGAKAAIAAGDSRSFTLTLHEPLSPGYYQFMAEKAGERVDEALLHFLGCGFRVLDE